MRINLNNYPSVSKTYAVDFPKLNGGLNLRDLDYRLETDESPEMRNLWWQNGVLQCRDGQVLLASGPDGDKGFACTASPFYGYTFFHIGGGIYYADVSAGEELTLLASGVPESAGTFFRYQDFLFYKNRGGFYKIVYAAEAPHFSCRNVADEAYTPVTVINAAPENGSGAMYQPENRLNAKKTIHYNAASGVTVYHLPAAPVDAVDQVIVDGAIKTAGTDYAVDLQAGTITFSSAPPVTNPATNNTVRITYSKANPDAMNSILDCEYAMVAGGDTNLCILLAGCPAQPNAVFWNSNDAISMNCAYFPMSYYNLVGDTEDPVTGFGKQYSTIVVLKERSVGKLGYGIEKVDDRDSISFTYADINTRVGCDLPQSIQLIENNLVWANTYQGVHMLRSSSAAFENNVDCISDKVNGADSGLLADLREAANVCSFDDDERYWLCAGDVCYVWDYGLSTFSDPSWFYFTNVSAVRFFRDDTHRMYHLDAAGRVTGFDRVFSDYGQAIDKVYRFPTQFFGSYDRLKDVVQVLLSVRSDTDTDISVTYSTDYETREDHTPIRTYAWRLSPRNLRHRSLSTARYAYVAKRRPGCRHIRHFAITLRNNAPGEDLSVVSMQLYYRFQGKER